MFLPSSLFILHVSNKYLSSDKVNSDMPQNKNRKMFKNSDASSGNRAHDNLITQRVLLNYYKEKINYGTHSPEYSVMCSKTIHTLSIKVTSFCLKIAFCSTYFLVCNQCSLLKNVLIITMGDYVTNHPQ